MLLCRLYRILLNIFCMFVFYVDLLQCTHEANVSVPQLADLIIQRGQSTNWVVVFKALITAHNIMNYGNEVSPRGITTSNRHNY